MPLTRVEFTTHDGWWIVKESVAEVLKARDEASVIQVTVVNRNGWLDQPESLALKPSHIKNAREVADPRNAEEEGPPLERGGSDF